MGEVTPKLQVDVDRGTGGGNKKEQIEVKAKVSVGMSSRTARLCINLTLDGIRESTWYLNTGPYFFAPRSWKRHKHLDDKGVLVSTLWPPSRLQPPTLLRV
jgi:hypothetical protein